MLIRPPRQVYHPAIPEQPEVPYRAAQTVCTTTQEGYWTTVLSTVRIPAPAANTGITLPAGTVSVSYEEIGGVLYAVCTVATRQFVVTGAGQTTCVNYPEQAYVPAVPAVPAWVETVYDRAWDAGANSTDSFPAGVSLKFDQPLSVGVVIGLTTSREAVPALERISHGIYFHQSTSRQPLFNLIEAGVLRSGNAAYDPADQWEIRRVGERVRYFRNSNLIYTSAIASAGEVSAACSIYAGGDAIP